MSSDMARLKTELTQAGVNFDIVDGILKEDGDTSFEVGWYSVSLRPHTEAAAKPRRLIFCIDGTWNDPSSQTNVTRLAQALSTREQDQQIVRYYSGVGVRNNTGPAFEMKKNWQRALESASKGWTWLPQRTLNWLGRRAKSHTPEVDKTPLGGTLGLGIQRIRRRVFFDLLSLYRPNDQIFVFGFSRGAAIARLLAQQIMDQGIPQSVVAVFRKTALSDDLIDRPLRIAAGDAADVPKVEMLGVWDTVSSYIIPGQPKIRLFGGSRKIAENVKKAYHLVAIDEQRSAFVPTLMEREDRIHEVWFPGVHTNVGGGYVNPKTDEIDFGICDITLEYMLNRAREHGVVFIDLTTLEPPLRGNPNGPIDPSDWKLGHESRKIYVEGDAAGKPLIHESVKLRKDATSYDPKPLRAFVPADYEIERRR